MKSTVCIKSILGVGYLGLIDLRGKKIVLELVSLAISDVYTAVSPFKLWINNTKIFSSCTSL